MLKWLTSLALPGWLPIVLRAAPWIALGLVIAALVVQRVENITVTGQRDRIIHVVDPTGKASPDQAIVLAQRVVAQRDAAKTALAKTVANYRLATKTAQANDLTHTRTVEARDANISGKVQHDLETQLAAARSDADAYARRLRAADAAPAAACADRGGSGAAGDPRPADAASRAADARAAAQLDDARVCAANTVTSEGWQSWWRQVSAQPR